MGLTMFGYGIGNISSYLNNAIQDEVDYLNAVGFFEKLCQNNGVDSKILKNILIEVEEFYDHEDESKFVEQSKLLSHHTYTEL